MSTAPAPAAPSRSRVTNEPGSSLAAAAEVVLPLAAGPELAVAATKTYTNQLAALALLAGPRRGPRSGARRRRSAGTADLLDELLPVLERRVSELAVSLAFVGRMFVIGRGPEFATAREISLKLLETCRVAAEPLTATDLVHGPVAAIDALLPRLDDRVGGREPAGGTRRRCPRPRGRSDPDRERHRGARDRGASTTSPSRRRRCPCCRRCSRSPPARCSRGRSRRREGLIQIARAA